MKKRIAIKVGSLGVSHPTGGVDEAKLDKLAAELADLMKLNFYPIFISSGAINCGKLHINIPSDKALSIAYQQACVSVGQPILMQAFSTSLQKRQLQCAQVLVTHEDFKDKKRFLNIRNTLNTLIENKIIPIINENDSVSFHEITVGDNDQLAAMITEASDAQKLIMLSESDGLFDKDPKEADAKRISEVDFQDDFSGVKLALKTNVGRGGMETKLKAIRKLTPIGVDVHLGSFLEINPIMRLLKNQGGTLFKGNPSKQKSKHKSWLSTVVKNNCWLTVDEGAANALLKNDASLLPVGVKKVHGEFKRGDVIQIKYKKKIIAIGLTEYSTKEVDKLKLKKSSEINEILPSAHSKVIIHKDNLYLKSL